MRCFAPPLAGATVVVLAAGLLAGCAVFRTAERDARAGLATGIQQTQTWAWPVRRALVGDAEALLAVTPWIGASQEVSDDAVEYRDGIYALGVRHGDDGVDVDFAVIASGSSGGGWMTDSFRGVTCFSLSITASADAIRTGGIDCAGAGMTRTTARGLVAVDLWTLGVPDTLDVSSMGEDPPEPLSESAHGRVVEALATESTADAVDRRLRRQLTQSNVLISVVAAGDEIGAAVGATGTTDCVLAVRHVDGTVVEPSYDRVWVQPGELGCSPDLYLAPPL